MSKAKLFPCFVKYLIIHRTSNGYILDVRHTCKRFIDWVFSVVDFNVYDRPPSAQLGREGFRLMNYNLMDPTCH